MQLCPLLSPLHSTVLPINALLVAAHLSCPVSQPVCGYENETDIRRMLGWQAWVRDGVRLCFESIGDHLLQLEVHLLSYILGSFLIVNKVSYCSLLCLLRFHLGNCSARIRIRGHPSFEDKTFIAFITGDCWGALRYESWSFQPDLWTRSFLALAASTSWTPYVYWFQSRTLALQSLGCWQSPWSDNFLATV